MTTVTTALVPEQVKKHPFHGLQVCETADLRLRPGSPRPRFEQEVWDLTGLADAPIVMSTHRKILDFTAITHPLWRLVAQEYLMARLAPLHPAVATLPHAFRVALNPHSLWGELRQLTRWFNHLTAAGVITLADVDQQHCEHYLAVVSRSTTNPDRVLSPGTTTAMVRVPQFLALYSELLSDGYRPGFTPWAGRSSDEVAGYTRTNVNRVPPVPDSLLRPLLANTLYLLDTISPHLILEAQAVRAADRHEAASRRGLLIGEIPKMRDGIEHRRAANVPAPLISTSGLQKRLKDGWDQRDPLLKMAWYPVVIQVASAMGHRRDLEILRPELEQWVQECGIQEPWCRNPVEVPRQDTGELVSWAQPMSRNQLDTTLYVVVSAAFAVTSALSGMRSSELVELSAGCTRRAERPGGASRFRLVTRRIKGEAFGGTQDAWVVIEDVHRAIRAASALTGATEGARLFATASNNSTARFRVLREWIRTEAGQRLGLEPIPDGPVNPRALRRTLAMAIAQRPHGLMAAKVHLKHVSVATTEGYTARPGGHQAAFTAQIAAEEEAEHMRLTVAAYEDYQRGDLPSGPGAQDLVASFQAVDQILNRHDPGPVTVIDDRRVERILKTKAKSLHVGVGNYCWFADPSKALCLKLAGTPDASEPLIGMCDSARCTQATHHPEHRQIWADHAETTRAVFLGNPTLSKPERARAQATFDRATRVVAEIDTTSAPTTEGTTHGS